MSRTRARGKKRTTKGQPAQQTPPQKRKSRKTAPPPGEGKKSRKRAQAASGRPWLVPLLVFVGLGVALVVALFAASQGK